MQKTLIVIGLCVVSIGLAWPYLAKLPFGRLPGDIAVKNENFSFYFPLATSLLVSLVLSLVLWLVRKLF